MPLLPALECYLSQLPPHDPDLTVEQLRAWGAAMGFDGVVEPGPELSSVTDREIPVAGGTVTVRVYTPEGEGPKPLHLYLHGGGFCLGTLAMVDDELRFRARDSGCVIVSVAYRLAPEFPYPTAVEDSYAALLWCRDHAAELGADAGRLTVGGASAGGNLAAVLCLVSRDRGGPAIRFQLLEIPLTDARGTLPSRTELGQGYGMGKADLDRMGDWYLGTDPRRRDDPYASPLLAEDLTGLPPAFIVTSEYDPLRDEGEAYARRLVEAGVRTTLKRWPGMLHGTHSLTAMLPEAAQWRDTCSRALAEAVRRLRAG